MNPSFSEAVLNREFAPEGTVLVEASAGTGKTYAIQTLFLRLVAERGFPVEKIVVVTFTEAAAAELRARLRTILEKARRHLEGELPESDDDRARVAAVCALPPRPGPGGEADIAGRVRRALLDFDLAAVSTIHGFCLSVLRRYALESGHEAALEIAGGEDEFMQEAARDWWRRNVLGGNDLSRALALESLGSPAKLAVLAGRLAAKPDSVLIPPAVSPERIEESFRRMLAAWDRRSLEAAIAESGVKETKLKSHPQIYGRIERMARGFFAADSFDKLERLAPAYYAADAFKKGFSGALGHEFIARCGEFLSARAGFLSWAAAGTAAGCRELLRRERILTYSGFIFDLRAALRDPERGEGLREAIRADYDAVLIDEFQDTDPVQYEIFASVFAGTGKPLVFVGDPKQAIYAFRSGDIHCYYRAAEKVLPGAKFSLDTNYRSDPALVKAINQLFGDRGGARTFRNPGIVYEGRIRAGRGEDKPRLSFGGRPDPRPFRIRYYRGWGKAPAVNSAQALRVYADVADEIALLLGGGSRLSGGRELQPSDIAVLVGTHHEAELIRRELERRKVPAVPCQTGSVLISSECFETLLLLRALENPSDPGAVRAALTAGLFACSAADLEIFASDPWIPGEGGRSFREYLELFREARGLWEKESFLAAFNFLTARCRSLSRLLGLPRGQRRATNFLHLAELVHRHCRSLGPGETIAWLAGRMGIESREVPEEFEIRLETDADSVKLMTVFGSKGLEFPVVFVPTLWRRRPSPRGIPYEYHRAGEGKGSVLDFDPAGPGKEEAAEERRQENLRLLYVACTRAGGRIYLAGGDCGEEDASPVFDLLGRDPGEKAPPGGPVELAEIPEEEAPRAPRTWPGPGTPSPAGALRDASVGIGEPRIVPAGGPASFTSISPHHAPSQGRADYDSADDPGSGAGAAAGVFAFPAGARTGECWHGIFEELDFSAPEAEVRETVSRYLRFYGLLPPENPAAARAWEEAVSGMVQTVLRAPLSPSGPVLKDVGSGDRLSELEFNFPLREGLNTRELARLLQAHWAGDPAKTAFLENLSAWDRPIPEGFMTGFIDLVFREGERYYLLDWKSNLLGRAPESFSPEGLRREMAERGYFLQYLIYAAALHAFLGERVPGYDCQRNFGGVFYVFLRGVDGTPGRGVYFDRPTPALLDDLVGYLLPAR